MFKVKVCADAHVALLDVAHTEKVYEIVLGAGGNTYSSIRYFYRLPPKDGEGTVFTGVCLSWGGFWFQVISQSLVPWPFQGVYPSHRFFNWSLVPDPFQGVPQSQGGYPSPRQGYPSPRLWSTFSPSQGYPKPGQDWVNPWPGQDWSTPPPPRQNNRANTCYAAGSTPLAFMEEVFSVFTL